MRSGIGHRLLIAALLWGSAGCSEAERDPLAPPPGGGEPYDHGLAPGASAEHLLTAADYDRLVLQVQYLAGHRPSDEGLQRLEDFLEARLDKPSGIAIQLDPPLPVQPKATYTSAEIRALEQTHRTVFTEGTTLGAYLLLLDGEFSEAANVLGLAYNNTSMALFQEKIEANTGGLTQPAKSTVEATVASHEIGHLLGLVDNGSPMQAEHRDEANGHHCDDQQCLMYYAVRTTDFLGSLTGGTVPSLDPNCLADLRANGGK